MRLMIGIASLLLPGLMLLAGRRWPAAARAFDACAWIAALLFGNIAAFSVYEIIRDGTVFMTKIHAVFLNEVFLASGSYLGLYAFYLLLERTFFRSGNRPR
ncbi:transposase [Cohnella fermenti]|uniref:Transposase n=1 Tax=Cohnella fermenti TaxID=2565925 RepID=A0A4S4C1X8_9BACL|nr:transposase [Cohnella fermenti]THF81673.1 transposase [Cohnella fermenti]